MKRAEGHTREIDSCQQRGCKKAINVQIANALAVHLNKLIQQKYTCWRKLQDIVNKHELFTILMITVGAGIITILNTCRQSKRFKLSISIKKKIFEYLLNCIKIRNGRYLIAALYKSHTHAKMKQKQGHSTNGGNRLVIAATHVCTSLEEEMRKW